MLKDEDLLIRLKTEFLYPPFLEKINTVLNNLADEGCFFVGTSGYRSMEEQAKIYAIGRTTPGTIKTKAVPGKSAHQYGCAIDFCMDLNHGKPGLKPSWDDQFLKLLADEAISNGLDSGFYWTSIHDSPHIQVNLKQYGIKWAKLISIHNQGGLQAVWAYLDQFQF